MFKIKRENVVSQFDYCEYSAVRGAIHHGDVFVPSFYQDSQLHVKVHYRVHAGVPCVPSLVSNTGNCAVYTIRCKDLIYWVDL